MKKVLSWVDSLHYKKSVLKCLKFKYAGAFSDTSTIMIAYKSTQQQKTLFMTNLLVNHCNFPNKQSHFCKKFIRSA